MIKTNRVSLIPIEAEWFARNVVKMTQLLETASQKDPKVLVRSTYKTLNSMVPLTVTMVAEAKAGNEKIDIILSKKQKLIIRGLVQSVLKTLVERVIPEYERRGDSHKEYLDNARLKAQTLEKMERKFK